MKFWNMISKLALSAGFVGTLFVYAGKRGRERYPVHSLAQGSYDQYDTLRKPSTLGSKGSNFNRWMVARQTPFDGVSARRFILDMPQLILDNLLMEHHYYGLSKKDYGNTEKLLQAKITLFKDEKKLREFWIDMCLLDLS